MKNIIIGTAGHIDHGKTTLIKTLTGRNTDRLKEEQKRGITIDLGFTWIDLKDGTKAGIIDVPGHEKFINNMVSGVCGMDIVMLVISAEEGIMPQTKEHLNILELLGIKKTILVLNKCDLVDEEWLMLMEDDVKESLKGTIMEDAPIVKVSAYTGMGIDELKDTILELTKSDIETKDINTIPRLPIDRVFTMQGFGTIVTGTLISGTIKKDSVLEIYPIGKECKIRSIQVHSKDKDMCVAGQRVAINISNVKKEELKRGFVLAPQNSMKNSRLVDVEMNILKDSNRILKNRDRLHLYTGTSEVLCRAVILDKDKLEAGESGLVSLIMEEDIALKRGDRFVVRFYSPLETIGGGVVLEPNARKKKRFNEDDIEELKKKQGGSLLDVCELNIKQASETMLGFSELSALTSSSKEDLLPYIKELISEEKIYSFELKKDTFFWHSDAFFVIKDAICNNLQIYHKKYPYKKGMQKAVLHTEYMKKIKPNLFDMYLEKLVDKGYIKVQNEYVSLSDFEILKDDKFLDIEKIIKDNLSKAKYEFIKFSEIDKKSYTEETFIDVARYMIEEKEIILLCDDTYTLYEYVEQAKTYILDEFKNTEIITIAWFRDTLSTSRKCAKAMIEYMDSIKITKKIGAETERVAY